MPKFTEVVSMTRFFGLDVGDTNHVARGDGHTLPADWTRVVYGSPYALAFFVKCMAAWQDDGGCIIGHGV
jgi:hypothetical protein